MQDDSPISRLAFDETAARLGISGAQSHMDELFRQVQGVLNGTSLLRDIDVSGTEPDMAFRPSGGQAA